MDDMNEVLALQELSHDGEERTDGENAMGGGNSGLSLLICDSGSALSLTCD